MVEIHLHGDKSEKVILTVTDGELYLSLELPETSLKKGTTRDNVQYYLSRTLRIPIEQQALLHKFLELANVAHQIQIKPKIQAMQVNLEQIINNTPPEALKQIAHKIEQRLEQLNEDKDETHI